MNKPSPFKNKTFFNSFRYALAGIATAFREERNMKSHVFSLVAVIIMGFIFSISISEWLWLLLVSFLVLVIEIINTAFENIVDFVSLTYSHEAKKIKDMSAAAVLIISTFAAIVGLVIFLPKIFEWLG